jgi:hypothetical protein
MSNFFDQALHGLRARLLGDSDYEHDFSVLEPTPLLIERAVDTIDPKMRAIARYDKKLKDPIKFALQFLRERVHEIPDGPEISKQSLVTDPRVRLFFKNADELQTSFSALEALGEHPSNVGQPGNMYTYVLLCMEKKEQSVFGTEMHGEIVKRDVQQTMVSFANPQLIAPSHTADGAREGFLRCAFDALLRKVTENIVSDNMEYKRLVEQRTGVLNSLKNSPMGSANTGSKNTFSGSLGAAAHPELQAINQQIARIKQEIDSPESHLDKAREVLNHPQEFISVTSSSVILNKNGVKMDHHSDEPGYKIEFAEIQIDKMYQRAAMVVRYPSLEFSDRSLH